MENNLTGKKLIRRPKIGWKDVIKNDVGDLREADWKAQTTDQNGWKAILRDSSSGRYYSKRKYNKNYIV